MKILLTGANGYIGMRLLPALLEAGHEVVCCVRDKNRFSIKEDPNEKISVVEIDFLKSADSWPDLDNINAAFYLIHSMSDGSGSFTELEARSATNFASLISTTGAEQIVYLSGIVNSQELSAHLRSRKNVEDILRSSGMPVTVLRAGIIVGSGSASFEIIRDLVEKLPVMIAPKWLNTRCQPIAIRNVIEFLRGVLNFPETRNKVYDIGGPEVLTYKEMLLQFGEVRGLKRYIFTVPLLTPRLSSLWLYFVTATSYNLARNLVDSMKIDVIAKRGNLREIIKLDHINYKQSVQLAFQKIEQNLVLSSWKDALVSSGSQVNNVNDFIQVPIHGCFRDQKRIEIEDVEQVRKNIWAIGGDRGWYYATTLWKLRGYFDKLVGGIGLRRGRRSPTEIFPGDALDFWRVIIASQEQKRLLLYAEMRLPGEAWLEFQIKNDGTKSILTQTATFRPKGLLGRLYWYSVWPFHLFVFSGMINRIANFRKS